MSFISKKKMNLIVELPGLIPLGCCFIPGRNAVAVSFEGGELRVIDISKGLPQKKIEGKIAYPGSMVVTQNGSYLSVLDYERGWRKGE